MGRIKSCNHDTRFTICTECLKVNHITELKSELAAVEAQIKAAREWVKRERDLTMHTEALKSYDELDAILEKGL